MSNYLSDIAYWFENMSAEQLVWQLSETSKKVGTITLHFENQDSGHE